jgi:hypothetical protein
MKSILAEAALATGWTIVDHLGEADVQIGGLTLTDEDVVVSGDSVYFSVIPSNMF